VSAKETLHNLVELLPDKEIPAASRFLQFLMDEAAEEPLSEEDWAEIRAGEAAIARGEFTLLDDLKREMGS
jgi:predicted transcriptional regulator